jgi:ribose transport system ATP-binding protein
MIHQELSVMPELSVAENLFLGRQMTSRWGVIKWKQMKETAEEELAKLGFEHIDVQKPLGEYPLGTQQVVEVLRVMLSGAQILIMDGRPRHFPGGSRALIEFIDTLRHTNRSVIYISTFSKK